MIFIQTHSFNNRPDVLVKIISTGEDHLFNLSASFIRVAQLQSKLRGLRRVRSLYSLISLSLSLSLFLSLFLSY